MPFTDKILNSVLLCGKSENLSEIGRS